MSGADLVYGVYATDLTWQNPVGPLFTLPPSLYKYEGIAYDAKKILFGSAGVTPSRITRSPAACCSHLRRLSIGRQSKVVIVD